MAAIDARGDDVVLRLEDNERSLMLTVFTDLAALLAEDEGEDGRPDSENWEARLGLVERPRPDDPALLQTVAGIARDVRATRLQYYWTLEYLTN